MRRLFADVSFSRFIFREFGWFSVKSSKLFGWILLLPMTMTALYGRTFSPSPFLCPYFCFDLVCLLLTSFSFTLIHSRSHFSLLLLLCLCLCALTIEMENLSYAPFSPFPSVRNAHIMARYEFQYVAYNFVWFCDSIQSSKVPPGFALLFVSPSLPLLLSCWLVRSIYVHIRILCPFINISLIWCAHLWTIWWCQQ